MLKPAIIGAGFMGTTHTEALRRLGIEVAGVLGADSEESKSFASQIGVEKAYENLDDLLNDNEVDVVHLCTPNYLHYPMAKAALLAGKHVMCEKPLANDSRQAAELVKLESECRRVGAVNYSIRFYPLNLEARQRIQSGDLGQINIMHGEYCQDWLFLPSDWNWRLEPELGGNLRVVADIGTHWMDLVTWMTGLEIAEVIADFSTFHPVRYKPAREVETFSSKLVTQEGQPVNINTEDYAAILMKFSNDGRGSLTLSQVSAGRKNNLWWEINGSKSSLSWHQETPNELWAGYREKANETLLKDPALMSEAARPTAAYPGGHAEGYPDTFVQAFKSFYGYLSAGKYEKPRPFATFEDGRRELILCEAIQQSVQQRCWMPIQY